MQPVPDPLALQKSEELAAQHLFATVYPELKRIASRHIRCEQHCNTMRITALVHETYLRLARGGETSQPYRDRGHFFALASMAMRNILVDRARARMAKKRDAAAAEEPFHGFADTKSFMDLHEALSRLAALDSRQAQIVEMRFFGGCTEEEVAEALGVSSRTVKREWRLARVWLYGELSK